MNETGKKSGAQKRNRSHESRKFIPSLVSKILGFESRDARHFFGRAGVLVRGRPPPRQLNTITISILRPASPEANMKTYIVKATPRSPQSAGRWGFHISWRLLRPGGRGGHRVCCTDNPRSRCACDSAFSETVAKVSRSPMWHLSSSQLAQPLSPLIRRPRHGDCDVCDAMVRYIASRLLHPFMKRVSLSDCLPQTLKINGEWRN